MTLSDFLPPKRHILNINPSITEFRIHVEISMDYEENLYNKQDNQLVIQNNQNMITCAKNA